MRKTFLFFFLFLILIHSVISLVSRATIDIPNEKPSIIAISISGNYLKTAKINILDKNGINDIDYVKIKIVYLDNQIEENIERLGDNYTELNLIENSKIEGVYAYDFEMTKEDKQGVYRAKFKIKDSGQELNLNQDFVFAISSIPTGAFIQPPTESFLKKPFLKFISAIKRLFRWGES